MKREVNSEEERLLDNYDDLKVINKIRRELHHITSQESENNHQDYIRAAELLNDLEWEIWKSIEEPDEE